MCIKIYKNNSEKFGSDSIALLVVPLDFYSHRHDLESWWAPRRQSVLDQRRERYQHSCNSHTNHACIAIS